MIRWPNRWFAAALLLVALAAAVYFIVAIGTESPPTPAQAARSALSAPARMLSTRPHAVAGPPPAALRESARRDPRWESLAPLPEVPPVIDLSDPEERVRIGGALAQSESQQKRSVSKLADQWGWPTRFEADGVLYEFMGFRNGLPVVFQTFNKNAAISTAANLVRQTAPYDLDGDGLIVGVWDGGGIRTTHQEFGGRVTIRDGAALHYHSTHVGGTIGAAGVVANAKGMAPAIALDSYEWNSDQSEALSRAMSTPGEPDTIQISNHSYGNSAGWPESGTWIWYGVWGEQESNMFGAYSVRAVLWDTICYNAPYYLPFKSAGNDRNDSAPGSGTSFYYYDDGLKTKAYNPATDPPRDGWDSGGFDTISDGGNAKNIMTVGAIDDARGSGNAAMLLFSSWGPADDGRIKPDIVANGGSLYSTYHDQSSPTSDNRYAYLSGTSMSSPNAAGSAALLVEQYHELFSGYIRNNTLKGLILHTADDMGNSGPDYSYGWGLMNTKTAADLLRRQALFPEANILCEGILSSSNQFAVIPVLWDKSSPLRATICWTDPPGAMQWDLDVRTPSLVNDLDLRIVCPDGVTNFPYVLTVLTPTMFATRGDNIVDNTEQVYIAAPTLPGIYSVVVSHKGTLFGGSQHYAVWISGGALPPIIEHTPLPNTTETNMACVVDATIRSMVVLDTNSLWLCWNTNGSTTVFSSNLLSNVSNELYRAEIPAQPRGAAVWYYLQARAQNGWITSDPTNAPTAMHRFHITSPLLLTVTNAPAAFDTVVPDYGDHAIASGATVRATATLLSEEQPDHRQRNAGWTGSGDVPATGATQNVEFTLTQPSQITWVWQEQWALLQTSSIPALWHTATWWDHAATAQTDQAAAELRNGETDYRFAEWRVAGLRLPDATNRAANPATAGVMTTSVLATAVYLPAVEDADSDGLADWWERFFYGSTNAAAAGDEDADGAANTNEFNDGTDPRDTASFPQPPGIEHTPLPSPQMNPAPWPVSAVVTDNHSVAAVTLNWRRNGAGWQSAAMSAAGAEVYTGAIPAPGTAGDIIEYYIGAADNSGEQSSNAVTLLAVTYPISSVAPTNTDLLLLHGATTNIWLSVTNWGTTNMVWTIEEYTEQIGNNVESGTNAWQHDGNNDLWHISAQRAFSGSHSWYCGSPGGEYQNNMRAALYTPPLALGSNAVLTFKHWMDAELSYGSFTYDGAIVEISTNEWLSYAQIHPDGGYPYLIHSHSASPWQGVVGCFGDTGGWQPAVFDLAEYAGRYAQIRFQFGSDGSSTEEGWYIDDIAVRSILPTNHWLHAAPRQGIVPNAASAPVQLSIESGLILPGDDPVGLLRFFSNDPISPTNEVRVIVRPRTIPEVEIVSAAQISTNGSGRVAITHLLYDADRESNSLEIMVSTNSGAAWDSAWLTGANAALGSPVLTNSLPQITGIITADWLYRITNTVTAVWGTTNSLSGVLLTNTLVRARAWDGRYWSAAVTSQPFMVDNQAPGAISNLIVTTHLPGTWSSNRQMIAQWSAADDGMGAGVAGYGLSFATAPGAAPDNVVTTSPQGVSAPLADGSNWWVAVRPIDLRGNVGPSTNRGAFRIDATPPVAGVVSAWTEDNGAYVMGTVVTSYWAGFNDGMSGIDGYYYATSNASPTAGGHWTTGTTGILALAAEDLDQTNTVYVWARDRAGQIGLAAWTNVMVLDPDTDFDDDGHTTAEEAIAGTDGRQAGSVLRFIAVTNSAVSNAASVVLRWPSVPGRYYSLYERNTLTNGEWLPMPQQTNLAGTGATMSRTGTVESAGTRFYRIGVSAP